MGAAVLEGVEGASRHVLIDRDGLAVDGLDPGGVGEGTGDKIRILLTVREAVIEPGPVGMGDDLKIFTDAPERHRETHRQAQLVGVERRVLEEEVGPEDGRPVGVDRQVRILIDAVGAGEPIRDQRRIDRCVRGAALVDDRGLALPDERLDPPLHVQGADVPVALVDAAELRLRSIFAVGV